MFKKKLFRGISLGWVLLLVAVLTVSAALYAIMFLDSQAVIVASEGVDVGWLDGWSCSSASGTIVKCDTLSGGGFDLEVQGVQDSDHTPEATRAFNNQSGQDICMTYSGETVGNITADISFDQVGLVADVGIHTLFVTFDMSAVSAGESTTFGGLNIQLEYCP